jgi:hypothetical protein
LRKAYEGGIVIDGIDGVDGGEDAIEKAIATVYANTMGQFREGETKKMLSVLFLWVLYRNLPVYDIDSCLYCLDLIHEIAPTSIHIARYLLLSQSDPRRPDDFIPLQTVEWGVVASAIRLLEGEKNGETQVRMELLRRLKATGRYGAFLGE